MNDNNQLADLVAIQFRLYAEAKLSRSNAAKLISTHGESITSNFYDSPPPSLVTVRPRMALEASR
jgi:hypothetical protein